VQACAAYAQNALYHPPIYRATCGPCSPCLSSLPWCRQVTIAGSICGVAGILLRVCNHNHGVDCLMRAFCTACATPSMGCGRADEIGGMGCTILLLGQPGSHEDRRSAGTQRLQISQLALYGRLLQCRLTLAFVSSQSKHLMTSLMLAVYCLFK
jgi:hypothetical protein